MRSLSGSLGIHAGLGHSASAIPLIASMVSRSRPMKIFTNGLSKISPIFGLQFGMRQVWWAIRALMSLILMLLPRGTRLGFPTQRSIGPKTCSVVVQPIRL